MPDFLYVSGYVVTLFLLTVSRSLADAPAYSRFSLSQLPFCIEQISCEDFVVLIELLEFSLYTIPYSAECSLRSEPTVEINIYRGNMTPFPVLLMPHYSLLEFNMVR